MNIFVIPARCRGTGQAAAGVRRRADTHRESHIRRRRGGSWIPAFAGMTAVFLMLCQNAHAAASKADAAAPVAVDPKLCQALVKHTPDADVAYQPGVDVHGKPVAPADLRGSPQMELPSTINIPLTVQLAKVLNLNTSQYPYNQLGTSTEASLGTLTVSGDKVLFNGKPLSDEQQDNLAVLCMKPDKK